VRSRWVTGFAVTAVIVCASAPMAAASKSKSPAPPTVYTGLVTAFIKADRAFAAADARWSNVVNSSNAPSWAELNKADQAFVPAIKTFNTALGKIHFTGKTEKDLTKVIALQAKEIAALTTATSISSFESKFGPLAGQFEALQVALGNDLHIEAAEIYL